MHVQVNSEIDPEYLKLALPDFLAESQGNNEKFRDAIMEMESPDGSLENLNQAFRAIHTIKGSAGSLGFATVTEVAHYAESVMQLYRDAGRKPDPVTLDCFIRVSEVVEGILKDISERGAEDSRRRHFGLLHELENAIMSFSDLAPEEQGARSGSNAMSLESGTQRPGSSSRVSVTSAQIDGVMEKMGEVLYAQNRLDAALKEQSAFLADDGALRQLDLSILHLQSKLSGLRLSPVLPLFNSMKGVVRSSALAVEKSVKLQLEGTETLIDRSVMEAIRDPLIHILRNAVDHGIESVSERSHRGKNPEGTITLKAHLDSGEVVIQVRDDGQGIDTRAVVSRAIEKGCVSREEATSLSDDETYQLLFLPGFSTRSEVTELSGRGVGMDVVLSSLKAVGGTVRVESEVGGGSTFTLRIPSDRSIIPSLFVQINGRTYLIPLSQVKEVMSEHERGIQLPPDAGQAFQSSLLYHGRPYPWIDLEMFFSDSVVEADRSGGVLPQSRGRTYLCLSAQGRELIVRVTGMSHFAPIYIEPLVEKHMIQGPFSGLARDKDGAALLQIDVNALMESVRSEPDSIVSGATVKKVLDISDVRRLRQKIIVFGQSQKYAIPLQSIVRILSAAKEERKQKSGEPSYVIEGDRFVEIFDPLEMMEDSSTSGARGTNVTPTHHQGVGSGGVQCEWYAVVVHAGHEYAVHLAGFSGVRMMQEDCSAIDGHPYIFVTFMDCDSIVQVIDIHAVVKAKLQGAKSEKESPEENRTILIAEDDAFFRPQLVALLKTANYEPVAVEDGAYVSEALKKLERPPLAIVSDFEMPGLDGISLCRAMKSAAPTSEIPFIMFSAVSDAQSLKKGMEAGAFAWVSKMDSGKLLQTLKQVASAEGGQEPISQTRSDNPAFSGQELSFSVGKTSFCMDLSAILEVSRGARQSALPLQGSKGLRSADC